MNPEIVDPILSKRINLVTGTHRYTLATVSFLLVVFLAVILYCSWKYYAADLERQIVSNNQRQASLGIGVASFAYQYVATARLLALSPRFTLPEAKQQSLEDGPFSSVRYSDALSLSRQEHITSWLSTEFGPPRKIPESGAPDSLVSIWKVTRGLPIRTLRGGQPAASSRALVDSVLGRDSEIVSIAKLDSLDRVVFVSPYSAQVKLKAFTFSSLIPKRTSVNRDKVLLVRSPLSDEPSAVGFLATGVSSVGIFRILVTTRSRSLQDLSKDKKDQCFAVYDSNGLALINTCAGFDLSKPSAPAEDRRPTSFVSFLLFLGTTHLPNYISEAPLIIDRVPYKILISQRLVLPPSTFRYSISFMFAMEVIVFAFVFWRLSHFREAILLLINADASQKKKSEKTLKDLFETIDKAVKGLAHSYSNTLISLRSAVEAMKSDRTLEERAKLENILHELFAFGQDLSLDLVPKAFKNAGVEKRDLPLRPTPSLYLRGTLAQATEQYKDRLHIPIIFDETAKVSEPFVVMSYTSLIGIVSNLLKNSVEACLTADKPQSMIVVREEDHKVIVQFIDNGCGIPLEDQERLFSGFSTKGPGRGQGLLDSRERAQSESASLSLVRSCPGETVMELVLPRCETPSWFVSTLLIRNKGIVVVVDDEGGVGDYWESALRQRYEKSNLPGKFSPRIIKLIAPEQLVNNENNSLTEGTLFLIDYKFAPGSTTNGVDLISKLGIAKRAILVTGHYDDTKIVSTVVQNGIRLLPKSYMYSTQFTFDIGGDDEPSGDFGQERQ